MQLHPFLLNLGFSMTTAQAVTYLKTISAFTLECALCSAKNFFEDTLGIGEGTAKLNYELRSSGMQRRWTRGLPNYGRARGFCSQSYFGNCR